MGLLQKKPVTTSSIPQYTIGGQQLMLIVGLGNPESKYDNTRHNSGYAAVDFFHSQHSEFSNWVAKKELQAQYSLGSFGNTRVILAKPQTYMNNSGQAVQAIQTFYKIPPSQTIVVYDELDVPFGQIRMRSGGGSAGHNGIKSIIEHTGDGFGRVRLGISSDIAAKEDSADFVLKPFSAAEKKLLPAMLQEADSILTECVFRGEVMAETRSFLV